jgi:hypothetical protein
MGSSSGVFFIGYGISPADFSSLHTGLHLASMLGRGASRFFLLWPVTMHEHLDHSQSIQNGGIIYAVD